MVVRAQYQELATVAPRWLLELAIVSDAVATATGSHYRQQLYGYVPVQPFRHNDLVDGAGAHRQHGLPVSQAW